MADTGEQPAPPETSDPAVAAETPAPETYSIDGEDYTYDQVNEWRQGGLRQADYTQKTQELANMRAEYSPLMQLRQRLENDPALVQKIRDHYEGGGQVESTESEYQDPAVQKMQRDLAQTNRHLSDLAYNQNQVQAQLAEGEVLRDLNALADANPDIDRQVVMEQLPMKMAQLGGQGLGYSTESMELVLRGMVADHRMSEARTAGQDKQKEVEAKRRISAGVTSGKREVGISAPKHKGADRNYNAVTEEIISEGNLDWLNNLMV